MDVRKKLSFKYYFILGSLMVNIIQFLILYEKWLEIDRIPMYKVVKVPKDEQYRIISSQLTADECENGNSYVSFTTSGRARDFQDNIQQTTTRYIFFLFCWLAIKAYFGYYKIKNYLPFNNRMIPARFDGNRERRIQYFDMSVDLLPFGLCNHYFLLVYNRCLDKGASWILFMSAFMYLFYIGTFGLFVQSFLSNPGQDLSASKRCKRCIVIFFFYMGVTIYSMIIFVGCVTIGYALYLGIGIFYIILTLVHQVYSAFQYHKYKIFA